MATRNVVLTDRQQQLIDTLVESGRYQNASEVLCEGLRLIEHREAEEGAKLAALQEAARLGMLSLSESAPQAFSSAAALRRHLEEIGAQAIAHAKRER